jgi:hypothetical protein
LAARSDENVGGLDVVMDDAFGVSGVERVGDLNAEIQRLIERERLALNGVLESLAFEVFHDDERMAALFADFVDGTDIGMIQRGSSLGFVLEALKSLRILCDAVGKKFQGNEAAELDIFGLVDDTHTPPPSFSTI